METILITGGTGLIGTALSAMLLKQGYKVIVFSRKPRNSRDGLSFARWDPDTAEYDRSAIESADHIIHLAGEGIADKRWNEKRKKAIAESRIKAGNLLVKALRESGEMVKTIVAASGIGWYGADRPGMTHGFTEDDKNHDDFLGETCRKWEESVRPLEQIGKRLVILRTGIVFSREGGAFPEFLMPMKFGVAGILGGGKQVMSWIHIDDICRMYVFAIENKNVGGVYNAVSPEPVTNKSLTIAIAKRRRRPFIAIHVPEFALQIYMGEMKIEVLKSTTVDNSRIRSAGFNFLYPSLDAALNVLVSASS